MAFYIQNLYKNVIQDPAKYFDELKIISGFASPKFLKRVITDFPNHKICLIIGMTPRGLCKQDHEEFKEICNNYINIEVLYKKKSPTNHMKIYQWYKEQVPGVSFVGSANFSETGFFLQEEVLIPLTDIFSDVIENLLLQSICCLDKDVENLISFYENIDYDKIVNEENLLEKNDYEPAECIINEEAEDFNKNEINLKKFLLNNLSLTTEDKVYVELILEDDPHWNTKSLNSWNRKYKDKKHSYIDIERTNKLGLKKLDFFPRDKYIQLISDDKTEWTVERLGQYGKELTVIKGINFYEYFKNRLNIYENRTISYEDLCKYGRTNVGFYKLSDTEYFLDFSLN